MTLPNELLEKIVEDVDTGDPESRTALTLLSLVNMTFRSIAKPILCRYLNLSTRVGVLGEFDMADRDDFPEEELNLADDDSDIGSVVGWSWDHFRIVEVPKENLTSVFRTIQNNSRLQQTVRHLSWTWKIDAYPGDLDHHRERLMYREAVAYRGSNNALFGQMVVFEDILLRCSNLESLSIETSEWFTHIAGVVEDTQRKILRQLSSFTLASDMIRRRELFKDGVESYKKLERKELMTLLRLVTKLKRLHILNVPFFPGHVERWPRDIKLPKLQRLTVLDPSLVCYDLDEGYVRKLLENSISTLTRLQIPFHKDFALDLPRPLSALTHLHLHITSSEFPLDATVEIFGVCPNLEVLHLTQCYDLAVLGHTTPKTEPLEMDNYTLLITFPPSVKILLLSQIYFSATVFARLASPIFLPNISTIRHTFGLQEPTSHIPPNWSAAEWKSFTEVCNQRRIGLD